MRDHRQASAEITKRPPSVVRYMRHLAGGVVCLIAVMVLVVGCASSQRTGHGIGIAVSGTVPVFDIQILYGEKTIIFSGKTVPGAGSLWNAPMPIPDSMTVQWTVNDIRKSVNIDLRDKLPRDKPLENWRLIFIGEQVELWREVLIAPPATPTGLRPRAREKVYP